ncbi:hypothetical protein GYN24_04295 [Lactococcus piscium]|uniref:head-tail connector protein n=1 Tax=Pseudolactococcus paracarnosus TaxID=2749962 RepID=UPI001FB8DC79|nr:head-tail connector protein [Lactococcus paracarnosus]MCJ1993798.1 hypothetical protein [Lactococcus paracarnosus]
MALITAKELLSENHIDESDEEIDTMSSLISSASALIRGSISDVLTDEHVLNVMPDQYNRTISALATRFYYNRDLSEGYGLGIQIMINQIRARMLEVVNGKD